MRWSGSSRRCRPSETGMRAKGRQALKCAKGAAPRAGFTLTELLVVIATICILAALLLPSLSRSKALAQSVSCQSNLKQLQAAYQNYANDNREALPPNISRRLGFDQVNVSVNGRVPWVLGNAQLDTNTANLKAGVLFHYIGSTAVYHCPADRSTVRNQPTLLRTRSYSLNLWLNADILSAGNASDVNVDPLNRRTMSQIADPPPVQTWVFIDEHPLSIDDGIFLMANAPPNFFYWSSYRGDQHNNGANLSFADGHLDHYRWRCRRNFPKYTWTWIPTLDADDRADFKRLQDGLPHPPQQTEQAQ